MPQPNLSALEACRQCGLLKHLLPQSFLLDSPTYLVACQRAILTPHDYPWTRINIQVQSQGLWRRLPYHLCFSAVFSAPTSLSINFCEIRTLLFRSSYWLFRSEFSVSITRVFSSCPSRRCTSLSGLLEGHRPQVMDQTPTNGSGNDNRFRLRTTRKQRGNKMILRSLETKTKRFVPAEKGPPPMSAGLSPTNIYVRALHARSNNS